jgi:hypothetical protein
MVTPFKADGSLDLDAFRALAGLDAGVRLAVVSDEAPPELHGAADVVVGGPGELLELLKRL